MGRHTRKLKRALRRRARSPRTRYLILTAGAAWLAERVVRSALTQGWRAATRSDPPRNPERLEVSWKEAFAWTALTGLAFSTAGLLARRAAAIGWKRTTGRRIPA